MCSMACGLRNSSKIPPAISRIPSRPLSTRPILNVLSSAGDSGGAGALALVRERAIGPGLPSDSRLNPSERTPCVTEPSARHGQKQESPLWRAARSDSCPYLGRGGLGCIEPPQKRLQSWQGGKAGDDERG